MGLGKTVELLACILAHRKSTSDGDACVFTKWQDTEDQKVNLKRLKRERVECICGAVSDSYRYRGLWVQCDICDAWQHADCVGYSPRGKKKRSGVEVQKQTKETTTSYVNRDGEHVCQMCSELIQATDSTIATGATLIVCPAPILCQWHAEITRYNFLLDSWCALRKFQHSLLFYCTAAWLLADNINGYSYLHLAKICLGWGRTEKYQALLITP